jgi:hypothetical protein
MIQILNQNRAYRGQNPGAQLTLRGLSRLIYSCVLVIFLVTLLQAFTSKRSHGSSCLWNFQCGYSNSRCVESRCDCRAGYKVAPRFTSYQTRQCARLFCSAVPGNDSFCSSHFGLYSTCSRNNGSACSCDLVRYPHVSLDEDSQRCLPQPCEYHLDCPGEDLVCYAGRCLLIPEKVLGFWSEKSFMDSNCYFSLSLSLDPLSLSLWIISPPLSPFSYPTRISPASTCTSTPNTDTPTAAPGATQTVISTSGPHPNASRVSAPVPPATPSMTSREPVKRRASWRVAPFKRAPAVS